MGGDASKGYIDFDIIDDTGTTLHTMQLDDTPAGHRELFQWLSENCTQCAVKVGFEASGGVERNWMKALKNWAVTISGLKVYEVNPFLVSKHRESLRLHEAITDPTSARAIAEYLLHRDGKILEKGDMEIDEARRLEQFIASQTKHLVSLKTQLQQVIVNSHPELVRYARNGISDWFLTLLSKYPTMQLLEYSSLEDLVEIPYVTIARAERILEAARISAASSTSPATKMLIENLTAEISRLAGQIAAMKAELVKLFPKDQTVSLYASLPGIGLYIAVVLRLVLGDCSRFHSEAAVIAYCGLDCKKHQSGDKDFKLKISKRGNSRIRALLYLSAMAAIRDRGRFAEFFTKLKKEKGKPGKLALVAVMGKLLRIAYALQVKKTPYDAKYPLPSGIAYERPPAPPKKPKSLSAPISKKEARSRKKAAASPNEVKPQKAGMPL